MSTQPPNPPSTQVGSASGSSRKDSNRWTTIKPGLVLGLKAAEMALDGLPIPAAKGCVRLILHFLETADLATGNVEALEALQRRLDSLQEVLLPVYANNATDVPNDVRKDVENLAVKLDKLVAQWKNKLEKKPKKRFFILRLINAKDDRESLTLFANAVEQTIQDFLVITITNGRIAAFREDVKSREARTLHLLPRAPAASYNSIRTGGATACLKGTRVSVLKTIKEWATNPDQPPIFWLNGLAGIGKTTIAHTIASELDTEGLLGASFVFLRADDQLKDVRLVFPTIAFQLAQFSPRFRTGLVEVLELDPDCGSKALDLQFAKLILQPFSAMSLSTPVIVILDALDECEPETLTLTLLRIIYENITSVPFLRVFMASRPEWYIRAALDLCYVREPPNPWVRNLVLHEDIHAAEVENDIRLFLNLRLQAIWDKRTKQSSIRWPSEDDLEKLVQQSGKLFVYAATAVRFITGNRGLNLNRQLSTLLRVKIGDIPDGEPYRQLDGLYLQILDNVFADSDDEYYIQRFRRVVGSIVLLERPLPLGSLANILEGYSVEEITETLYHLHSIIIVPTMDSEAPRTYHFSFPNFVTNPNRCTNPNAYIDPSEQAKYLFLRCLAVMARDFGSPSFDLPVEDIINSQSGMAGIRLEDNNAALPIFSSQDDLGGFDQSSVRSHVSLEDSSEDRNLPQELRYSNNYWCRHLMKIPFGDREAATALEHFIVRHFLAWLKRRSRQILDNRANPHSKIAGDTYDVIHDAHRWGVRSGCSDQCLAFLKGQTKITFGQLFPAGGYSFGKQFYERAQSRAHSLDYDFDETGRWISPLPDSSEYAN
ncbi:hypothetical protein D9619_006529 [Psilocybe cf. subviscida]|uniref:NACHT domain-containing protein n=1 Tax=Psilocybe cf. subviscida TaxID=2480587 RepID=A0A8H5B5S6_9AGAR|nr:hypothetical protein D9619_006529 [Psilocybe cf. subviscida]